jgi:outer membrane protein TolC
MSAAIRNLGLLLEIARLLVHRRGRGSLIGAWPASLSVGRHPASPVRRVRLATGPLLLVLLAPGAAVAQEPVQLTLEEALTRAEAASERVAIARAGVQRARGDRYEARSGYLPSIGATVGYTRTLESEYESLRGGAPDTASNPFEGIELPFGQANRYDLGVSASQTVFAGGRIRARDRIAGAGARRADLELASARAQLALETTRAFYDASLSDRLLAIAEASLAQAEQTLAQVQAAQRVGDKAEFETLRAQVARDNQRPLVIQRRTERDLAYMRLKQIVAVSDADTLRLVVLPDLVASSGSAGPSATASASELDLLERAAAAAPVLALDTAVDRRGAVRQAREAVRVRENLARIAAAERLPSLAVTTQYGRVGYPAGGLPKWAELRSNWQVGVQVELPVFTGGRIRGAQLKAEADVVEAQAQLDQARELAALDARASIEQVEAAEAAWQASTGTVEQAAKAYRIAELRYREGLSTQLELNDARLMLQQAEANRAVAARDLEVARAVVRLLPDLPLAP